MARRNVPFERTPGVGMGAHRERFPYREKGRAIREFDRQVRRLKGAMTPEQFRIAHYIRKEMTNIAYDVLEDAVKHCPYETGELRNSGVAELVMRNGKEKFPIVEVEHADGSGYFDLVINEKNITRASKRLSLEFSFEREDKGIDIAWWTHEELLPYAPRPTPKGRWFARKPGTGPFYLLNAVNKHIGEFEIRARKAVRRAIEDCKRRYKDLVR